MQPDRFTVKSQEAVVDALQLASRLGNPEAAPAHLLIALLAQDEGLTVPILQKVGADVASIRSRAEAAAHELPKLSGEERPDAQPSAALRKVLQGAEQEMKRKGDEYISTDHFLLALTDKGSGVADLLPDRGRLEGAIAAVRPRPIPPRDREATTRALEKFGRDPTAEGEEGKLAPVIGRDEEIRRVVQVLSRRTKN